VAAAPLEEHAKEKTVKKPIVTCCQPLTPEAQASIEQLAGSAWLRLQWSAIARAVDLAVRAHAGQFDKGAVLYIWHVLRVGFSLLPDVDACIVGILHDVLEDAPGISEAEVLNALGGDIELLDDLHCLTRGYGKVDWHLEPYSDYIQRAAGRPLSRKVKLADLRDNLNPERMARAAQAFGSESTQELRRRRYERAVDVLLTLNPPEEPRCSDCIIVRGRSVCTMNCGPCVPARS
jgi:(p)ppGpp synthase/HD superfamily hydrolase